MKRKRAENTYLQTVYGRLLTGAILFLLFAPVGPLFSQEASEEKIETIERSAVRASRNFTWEGNKELQEGDFTEAEMAYRKAIDKYGENAEARYNMGNAYYNNSSMSEAFMRFKEAGESFEDKSGRHKAYHNLGNVFMKNEEYAKAVEAYKEALRNNPEDEETRYNLALAKKMLENDQQQNNKDQDQKDDHNKDQQDQNDDQQDQKDKNQDQQGDKQEDNQEGDQEEQQGDQSEQKKNQQQQNKDKQPQPQEGSQERKSELSPQQIRNILEAMNNEEKKVQEKINAKKIKGKPVKKEKDW
ncbi:tetratricopeptide repeat protein [Robertkochia aurantiaca]|uniref:tetratricopeptide repeat protein n=1 Tax=Robertkochia aurantiaca TaxID=2873700 RepID=UPI001CCCB23A|nr:tetratricopeptide repeat protein [Robertkochia sp. 3YJGBD-33]